MSRKELGAFCFQEEPAGSDVAPTRREKTCVVVGNRGSDMGHQKTGDFASWFISQLSPLELP